MFGKSYKLFRLLGFDVHMDLSWVFIAVLFAWTLAVGVFPVYFKGLAASTYWMMGAIGVVGLFVSIIFHELSHSLVARRFGLQIRGITLFFFGGVAHMEDEAPSAKAEFLTAIAGPASSLVLALVFYLSHMAGVAAGFPLFVLGVLGYLASINVILAVFNMVPAFPLDGGRVLRSALWRWKKDLRWATRVASGVGQAFAYLLIGLGVFDLINGSLINGIWWILIGLFLRHAAQSSYQQLQTRRALEGEHVSRFMNSVPVTAPSGISVAQFVNDYIYRHHHKTFPVVDNGDLLGCVSTKQIKEIPRQEWDHHLVREVTVPCTSDNTITPDADAMHAISTMYRTNTSRLLVAEGGRLLGIVALKDMLDFLSLKMDLEA